MCSTTATHALRVLHQHGHLGGAFREVVAILLAHVVGDLLEGLVDGSLVNFQLHRRCFEMQRQRGLVADAVLEGIAAHVARAVFVRAEGPEGVAVRPVDRGAGQAKEEGIGQGLAHLAAQIALLRAVRLVHHHDDVLAGVPLARGLAKLVNGRDQHLAHVLIDQPLQFLPVAHAHHVGDIRRVEGGADLRVEVDAVHHDEHRGIAQPRVHP